MSKDADGPGLNKHQPATPLPWVAMRYGDGKVRTARDFGDGVGNLIAETAMQEQPAAKATNARYIAHACNVYPEVINKISSALVHLDAGRAVHATNTLRALLRSLDEED